jgi:hypothetical protein
MPVTTVNNKPVGDGRPGKITNLIRKRHWKAHDKGSWTTAVNYSNT